MADSFATRAHLEVGGKSYAYSSLAKLGERFDLARLPYSMKILLENLLRHEDGVTVLPAHIEAVASWDPKAESETEIAFMPARVLLQDFPAFPAWSTWRRCATRWRSWAASRARSTRWSRRNW